MSRIGLMHMIATNMCVWLSILISETSHAIVDKRHEEHHNFENTTTVSHRGMNIISNEILTENDEITNLSFFQKFDLNHLVSICSRKYHALNIMSKLLGDSGPFLFPCTIEYSLICAAILFVMWKNISDEHEHYKLQKRRRKISKSLIQRPNTTTDPEMTLSETENQHVRSHNHYSVDCTHANTGLFTGIFVMVHISTEYYSNEKNTGRKSSVYMARKLDLNFHY